MLVKIYQPKEKKNSLGLPAFTPSSSVAS